MGLLTTAKTRYEAQLAYWTARLTDLQAQLTSRAQERPVNSYYFDSGEGRQQTTRTSVTQLMAAVEQAERMVGYYERKLYGGSVVSLVLRRK